MRTWILFLLTAGVSLAAHAAQPSRVERGNLILEDVPEIPAALAERTNQYQQTRGANLVGWLPDGGILMRTRFAETAQIHRVTQPLGMREQLTFFPEPIGAAAPAPHGRSFLFGKDVGGNEFFQIYHFDLASGAYRMLTDGKSRNTGGQWSNRGDRFAFSTTRRNGRDTDVHVMAPGDTDSRPLLEREGSWGFEDWSPDDRQALLMKYVSVAHSEPWIVDLAGGEARRFHPTNAPIAFGSVRFSRDGRGVYYSSDENSEFHRLRYDDLKSGKTTVLSADINWDVEDIALSRDGRWLAFTVNADGVSELHLRDLRSARRVAGPRLPVGLIGGLEFSLDSRKLALVLNNAQTPSDIFVFEPGKSVLTRWTKSETGGLDATAFTLPTQVRYPSFDGRQIPAFFYKPAGAGPHPVLINIHGGPEGQSLPSFNPLSEFYLRELGVAVLNPNVRGSSGYGKSYLALDNGFQREDSVKDIGALLDWIAQQPELDRNRVAVIGGSYGGYMVLAAMTHFSERLRAGIDIVGISNFVTFLNNTQEYRRDLRRVEYGDERDPAMKEFLEKISPTANAHKIKRPMFIVQGANDPRVPASEAEQMVATIRAQGDSVWYLLAKDEGHGFAKKSNRDLYQNATILFLQRHLLAQEPAVSSR